MSLRKKELSQTIYIQETGKIVFSQLPLIVNSKARTESNVKNVNASTHSSKQSVNTVTISFKKLEAVLMQVYNVKALLYNFGISFKLILASLKISMIV